MPDKNKPDVVNIQKLSPVANVSVLELAVLLTYTRYAHADPATIAGEIAKWMKVELTAEDLRVPIRRLLHIGLLVEEDQGFDVTSDTYKMVINTLRQMMRLTLRDRYVFDLVEIIGMSHEAWGFVHDHKLS